MSSRLRTWSYVLPRGILDSQISKIQIATTTEFMRNTTHGKTGQNWMIKLLLKGFDDIVILDMVVHENGPTNMPHILHHPPPGDGSKHRRMKCYSVSDGVDLQMIEDPLKKDDMYEKPPIPDGCK